MADKKISALTAASTPLAGTEVLPIVQSGSTVKVAVSDLTAGRAMAALSLTTATVQATNSGGLALKNSGGTTQMLLGGGGGDNITLSVATNITPANAAVAISPTGTGTLTLNPATASTINNMSIGATTAATGRFTSVTATTGNFVVGTSGQGVDFSATAGTGTSELLADYEEGTWTPAINSAGGAVTYLSRSGSYTKVGNLITFNLYINFNINTATGALSIGLGALPAQKTGTDDSNWAVVYTRGFVFPANKIALYIYKYPSNAAALLQWQDILGAGGTSVDAASITAAFGSPQIMISGNYLTD